MKKIALSWYKGNINYINKLREFDIPYIVLSPGEKINWEKIGGIIFIGGEDIHPSFYNEEIQEDNLEINIERDKFELELMDIAFNKELPILGICRGCQLINVYLKGNLYQDLIRYKRENIITKIHWRVDEKDSYHEIDLNKDSFLHKILGKEKTIVNSSHHQAIKKLGEDLRVSAKFLDDSFEIIEGIEHKNYPLLLGVQWHPERLNNEDTEKLFKLFRYLFL
ncbi:MAG: gamma-glutamyl-gamma-aminobutyrate hydrolase family protein [Dictyoglomaceae bacterium]